MRRAAIGCVLLALATAPAVCAIAHRAAGKAVTVYVDGVKVGPVDGTTGAPLNAFVVGEVPMVPVRLFDAALHDGLDLYLWRWKVIQLTSSVGLVAFSVGDKVATTPVPAVAGSGWWPLELPIAPRIIDHHVYVPALPVLKRLGHATTWDPKTRVLRTTKKVDGKVATSS